MEVENPLPGYKYQVSPKYNNYELKSLRTPKITFKNETTEMILTQTKESLHNFLTNLKKSSILKESSEIKNITTRPKISGLSSISNSNIPEEIQDSYDTFNTHKLNQLTDNNNTNSNLETNILNYNKIYNTNNVYNLGSNSLIKNQERLRVNKKTEPPEKIHEKINTESDLNPYVNNNLISTFNKTFKKTDNASFSGVKRTKYNFSSVKNDSQSEKKNYQNKKIHLNLIEKIKTLKSENLNNKKDILNLVNSYNEMQNILLDKIFIVVKEKDNQIKGLQNKIKESENKINELKGVQKEKENVLEKNKKLLKEIELLNNNIKKLNIDNQELQKNIKNKDISLEKCNNELKILEEKFNKISNIDKIKYELKEKEDELNSINNNSDNKLRSYQELLLEYKTKNEELLKENKTITGQNNILKSQKKSLVKENTTNNQLIAEFKISNEKLIKERDEYKIKKEQLINEIEIIKMNNDRIYNIKTLTNNNTNKLKNEISSLKKEKEILGEKNEELQKRIKSLDRKHSLSKSLKAKSRTVSYINKKKFVNLKIIKNKEIMLQINNKNKNASKKIIAKKGNKKAIIKFKKLMISNKVVDININKKSGTNKKIKKKINKFKNVKQCSKIVDILIKNKPKPTPKPKKKKFIKLKYINGVVDICLKSKIKNYLFKSNKLKISSKINNLNIKSFNKKKEIEFKKSNQELFFIQKCNKNEEKETKEQTKQDLNQNKIITLHINKLDSINFERIRKITIFDINQVECFSFEEKENSNNKSFSQNLSIMKNEQMLFLINSKKIKKKYEYLIIQNNNFNLLSNNKAIKKYEISKNNLISFAALKKSFDFTEKKQDVYFFIKSEPKISKKIYEISSNNNLSFIKKKKLLSLKKEKKQSFMYIGIPKIYKNILKKENGSSFFFKPKRNIVLLSKSVNEQTNQNKPKIYSFFSNFLKGKKNNIIPMRILQVQYRRSKKDKLSALNKRNTISKQNKFNYLPMENKKKYIYSINKIFSFNYEKIKKITKYNIINTNSLSFEPSKKKFDLASNINPEMLEGEENLKQLVSELNIAITLKNEEIKRLTKEKSDADLAYQLFNDSSSEQIEDLTNNLNIIKEKNDKLIEEIENLKGEIKNNEKILQEKNKEYEENKNNLNKTIDELAKENSKLKLDLFKRGTEEENNSNNNQEKQINDTNNENKLKEYEKQIETLKEDLNKMRQSKILETNQLKLELTKNKVEMKRLTNQIKKLEAEKNEPKKESDVGLTTLKISDEKKTNFNQNEKDEINKLKNEIENYKNKMSEINIELKKNEELRHQNILLNHKLQEAQKKIIQANQVIAKAKKYSLCIAYISQFLAIIKPENEKQIYLANKLKEFTEEYQKEKSNK